jgi:predicted DNA-binding helix-hairpin-helix protein
MSKAIRKRDKWHFLRLGAQWDRAVVPIYEAAARGKCIPLLKTLVTSHCKNECLYCSFRSGRKCPRISWEPEKLARITIHLWKKKKIRGLFLTSSVARDPDSVTEKQLEVLRYLRSHGYTGYIHLRLMPGTSKQFIREASELSDRLGLNLEAPNKGFFSELCPDKGSYRQDVLKRLEWILDEAKHLRSLKEKPNFGFARSGVDTQMIVGAIEDNDWQYLQVTEWLYKKLGLKRIYYSGFEPLSQTPLEKHPACPPYREYRLYQASFLIRDYKVAAQELAMITDENGYLPNIDPKLALAKRNRHIFPIDLNTARYEEILKIPHIGPITAKKILKARHQKPIRYSTNLERIIGANLTRKIMPYVEVKDKQLRDFLKT